MMGDYVDRFGQGRNLTPGGLRRVAEALNHQPNGLAVNITQWNYTVEFVTSGRSGEPCIGS